MVQLIDRAAVRDNGDGFVVSCFGKDPVEQRRSAAAGKARLRSQKKNSTEGITQAKNATTKIICILLLFSDLETLFSIMTRTREKCNQIASS